MNPRRWPVDTTSYFEKSDLVIKKKYDALRMFYFEKHSAKKVSAKYGYTLSAFYSLARDFKEHLSSNLDEDYFFKDKKVGRVPTGSESLEQMIIDWRKKNFSTEDIVSIANAKNYNISYGYVYQLLKREGFSRLPRREKSLRENQEVPKIKAPRAEVIDFESEKFNSNSLGLFTFLPYIKQFKIDVAIEKSTYPKSKDLGKMNSILSFLALKLSSVRRYSADDLWCMDRGAGLFAGLNVLPKNAWYSSYSHRVTKGMNVQFLKELHQIWSKNNLLGDTSNLDFTSIPYWGENSHLENNWSGKRNKALSSMLAVLAQDPDSGIIDYGDTDVMHKNESAVVLEYLDFYRKNGGYKQLKYLVFDSKFTNYENLSKLDNDNICFMTIRRRGKNIVDKINAIPKRNWKTVRVDASGNKKRTLKVNDQMIYLKGYEKNIRQVAITGHGKIKPALIITNDFDLPVDQIIRKYTRRWLVEKGISEQIDFFHLNRVSSSMVIKVDFDLTMTILAHNLYRLLASDLKRYSHLSDQAVFEKFISNGGQLDVTEDSIIVRLKKKRNLPQILEAMNNFSGQTYSWLGGKKLVFTGATVS